MNIKIKYKSLDTTGKFVTESIDTSQQNLLEYCINLQKTLQSENKNDTDGVKIWIELNNEFILMGI
jgi:hypothetical protein